MFANNEQIHERLTPSSVLNGMTFEQLVNKMFSCPDDFSITEFCDMYEFIYDSRRNWLLFIVRDARLRLRKYLYLPPIYVAFDLNKDFTDWKAASLRYYMKFAPASYQLEQDEEYSYKLTEHPYMVAYHPHIDASANACYGRWHRIIEEESYTGFQVMEALRGFLNDYNGRSTFFNIDPYAHDKGKPGRNADIYPYSNGRICSDRYPKYWENTKALLTAHYGDDWMERFCEQTGRHRKIMDTFDFFYSQGSQEANNYMSWLDTLHQAVGTDEELSKEFGYYMVPENLHYNDEEYHDAIQKRNAYFDKVLPYHTPYIRRDITQFLMKPSGYDFTSGDLDMIIKGFMNWGFANLSYSKEFLKMNREIMDMRDSGSSYSLNSILNTFAFSERGQQQRGYENPSLNLLSLLINNKDLPNMALNGLMFEYYAKKSLDRAEYLVTYKKLKQARMHDWAMIDSLGTQKCGINMDGDLVTCMEGNWYYRPKEHGMQMGSMFNELISLLSYSAKRLVDRTQPCNKAMQKYLIHHLRDEVACNGNIDWSKEFVNNDKISDEELWDEILYKTLSEYSMFDFGSALEQWFRDYTYERFHANDDDMLLLEKYWLNGTSNIVNADDEEKKDIIKFFYTTFPDFPKNVEECYEHRNRFDKQAINQATVFFLDRIAKLEKGYRDVLTNTLPSVEQGELFSQQVSV